MILCGNMMFVSLVTGIKEWLHHFAHHVSNFTKHIKANVQQRFGQQAAKDVITISRSFSAQQEDHLLGLIQKRSSRAYDYLLAIPPNLWQSSEWFQ